MFDASWEVSPTLEKKYEFFFFTWTKQISHDGPLSLLYSTRSFSKTLMSSLQHFPLHFRYPKWPLRCYYYTFSFSPFLQLTLWHQFLQSIFTLIVLYLPTMLFTPYTFFSSFVLTGFLFIVEVNTWTNVFSYNMRRLFFSSLSFNIPGNHQCWHLWRFPFGSQLPYEWTSWYQREVRLAMFPDSIPGGNVSALVLHSLARLPVKLCRVLLILHIFYFSFLIELHELYLCIEGITDLLSFFVTFKCWFFIPSNP